MAANKFIWATTVALLGTSFLSANVTAKGLAQTQICMGDHDTPMQVEIADTFDSRARGLMHRESLGEHQGMWFKYTEMRPATSGFWMYNTLLPLDIAYVDDQQRVVRILQMQPCKSAQASQCPSYRPGTAYMGAVEMNLGYFEKYGIEVGDTLRETKDGRCGTPAE